MLKKSGAQGAAVKDWMWRSSVSIHAASILKYFSKLCSKWEGDLPSHGPVEADYLHIPGQPEPAAQPAYCCWWSPSGPAGLDSDNNKQRHTECKWQKQSKYTMCIVCGCKTVLQSNVYKPQETDGLLVWIWGTFHSLSHSQPSSYHSLWFIVDSRDHKLYFKCCRWDLHDVTWCTLTLCVLIFFFLKQLKTEHSGGAT